MVDCTFLCNVPYPLPAFCRRIRFNERWIPWIIVSVILSTQPTEFNYFTHSLSLIVTWIFWTAGAASITAALGGGYDCRCVYVFLLIHLASESETNQ